MRVAFIAAECEPWAKTGGLGDVVDALARSLGRLPGRPVEPVDVYLPRYRSVRVPDAVDGSELVVPDPSAPGGVARVRLLDVAGDGYRLRLVDRPAAFDRDRIYDFPDDAARFGLLCRAALEAIRRDERPLDILHLHDWHACPAVIFRDRPYRDDPRIGGLATVLTLHNLAYHGRVPADRVGELGLAPGDGVAPSDGSSLDLLTQGVERVELVNTVSPTYAALARTARFGFGLDGLLEARGDRFLGILNGLDPEIWDPARDPALAQPYGAADRSGKAVCRADLLRRLGMDALDDGPILGSVGRLDPQKGFELIVEAGPELLAMGARIVVQAAGDPAIAAILRGLESAHPGRVVFLERFDRAMARRIYAGADLLLVPSRFEPSGLVQMIAMRYGTPPVAHATGGLVDSIVDEHDHPGAGTGFLFRHPTAAGLAWAVGEALDLRGDGTTATWQALLDRAMAADFAWETTAAPAYLAMYRRARRLRGSDAA
jgi:starch synthase